MAKLILANIFVSESGGLCFDIKSTLSFSQINMKVANITKNWEVRASGVNMTKTPALHN